MTKSALAATYIFCLAGCYTPNYGRLSAHVGTLVRPDMPMDEAVKTLEADGFSCSPAAPTPSKTCARMRQRLLPSTCVERVNLYISQIRSEVELVEVPGIACAGF